LIVMMQIYFQEFKFGLNLVLSFMSMQENEMTILGNFMTSGI